MQRVWYLRGDGQKDRVSAFSRLRCVKHVLGTSTRLLKIPGPQYLVEHGATTLW